MNIVFLDRNTIGSDIDVNVFLQFGNLTIYSFTDEFEVANRIADADIVLTNKSKLNETTLKDSNVKLICVSATGTDNVDVRFCKSMGIAVCNVKGYSTESVVQHTFTSLFSLIEKIPQYNEYVKSQKYINDKSFLHLAWNFREIYGKNFGIIGMGAIGKRVAQVANAFGCNVFYWSSSDIDRNPEYKRLPFNELLEICDIISVHSPLTEHTYHLFGTKQFEKMKNTAVLVNMGRGDIIVEEDLVVAIETNMIGGAALDVLSKEPMSDKSPYVRVLSDPRLFITPHIAWASIEARERCINEMCLNISDFFDGGFRNRVDITV